MTLVEKLRDEIKTGKIIRAQALAIAANAGVPCGEFEAVPEDTCYDDTASFYVHYEKEGNVARALVAAGYGWLSDNGNRFHTRSSMAAHVFESSMCERDSEDANKVRRFV